VGGEEKCSECLRAAQLEERMECGRHSSSIAESSMRLSPGSHGARECGRAASRRELLRATELIMMRAFSALAQLVLEEGLTGRLDQMDSVCVKYRVGDTSQFC